MCEEHVTSQIHVDAGHPWRPPFGLERIGRPLSVLVQINSDKPLVREYTLISYIRAREAGRYVLSEINHHTKDDKSYSERITLDTYPEEVALFAKCRFQGTPTEVVRRKIEPPSLEADAVARPDTMINPVDLGMILFPADWLLLGPGQQAIVDVAAISRRRDIQGARSAAWFESSPRKKVGTGIELTRDQKAAVMLRLPATSSLERDVLHVSISDGEGKEIWTKRIHASRVNKPPRWPEFGATYTKLRFDAPISVRDVKTGGLSSMDYDTAWSPELRDVVVSLPDGARFVFWRGSSYVPFWAGKHNTGLSYEWAETSPPPGGFVDSVEPLMDKELRYGRVEILESTAARVHVRWTYQSCDFLYKVWGDEATEDFYFYPDGFGTRVLNLKRGLGIEYELSEFIILAPQADFPFSFLPSKIVDMLFLDGEKHEISFPYPEDDRGKREWPPDMAEKVHGAPIIYRVRIHKDEQSAAIYFNPLDRHLPRVIYAPFFDRGEMVTPVYWGSHWPLARGKSTGWSIDDRIYSSPSHNSVITWAHSRPPPLSKADIVTLDTLGQSKLMSVDRWSWLIAMTDASDGRLLEWARSYSKPPSLQVSGGRVDFDGYVPERRAIRLIVNASSVSIDIRPTVPCVNPVFELDKAQAKLESATLGGRPLQKAEYAWDGHTLWVNAEITEPKQLQLKFANTAELHR